MNRKAKCENCAWKGYENERLKAPNPFEAGEIYACPECLEIGACDSWICDEPECWAFVTCGTMTETGYKSTCSEHMPKAVTK